MSTLSTLNTGTHPVNNQDPSGVNDPQPQTKCWRVTVEEMPDKDTQPSSSTKDSQQKQMKDSRRVRFEGVPEDASPCTSTTGDSSGSDPSEHDSQGPPSTGHTRLRRYKGFFVEDFPDHTVGTPVSDKRASPPDLNAYMRSCGPMANPEHFEVAELLMTSKMTNSNRDRHLKSKMYEGRTPWLNCNAMLSDLDRLAHGPEFKQEKIEIFDGQRPRPQYAVYRDIIHIIRDFMANPKFKCAMKYKPFRMYTSASRKIRIYGEMASSNWWWKELQKLFWKGKRHVTIVPLIIATDQTMLSIMCGGQKAYPVYVCFGNLDKDWRRKPSNRGMYLLGYFPVDAFEDVPDDDERQHLKAELVHRVMEKMLEPLRVAAEDGVEMWCPDGRLRRVYPRIAAYTADWPEQCLQCCTSVGRCPICKTVYSERGQIKNEAELRERKETLRALRTYFYTKNEAHLNLLGLKGVWPWWGDIPGVNLSSCITPDLLHQTYQGMFKTHLVRWMKTIHRVNVLDDRFAAMPQAKGLRRFPKGISVISSNRWTGRESKQIITQFVPTVVSGLTPPLAKLVRVLTDFMYRAHASTLTDDDLDEMDADLRAFHELKHLLVNTVYNSLDHFNKISKLHMLRHWTHTIRELGTPDGYNTEAPEHLHIKYAKVPWRASNKVEPLPQMVQYIQRQEAICIHRAFLDQYLSTDSDEYAEDTKDAVDTMESKEFDLEELAEQRIPGDRDYPSGCVVSPAGGDGDVRQTESTVQGAGGEEQGDQSDTDVETVFYPNPTQILGCRPNCQECPY